MSRHRASQRLCAALFMPSSIMSAPSRPQPFSDALHLSSGAPHVCACHEVWHRYLLTHSGTLACLHLQWTTSSICWSASPPNRFLGASLTVVMGCDSWHATHSSYSTPGTSRPTPRAHTPPPDAPKPHTHVPKFALVSRFNVPHGKLLRGMLVSHTLLSLVDDVSPEMLFEARSRL